MREFGPQLLRLKQCVELAFAAELREPLAEEAQLFTQYVELMSTNGVELVGKRYTPAGIRKFLGVGDRGTRLEAQRARESFHRFVCKSMFRNMPEVGAGGPARTA